MAQRVNIILTDDLDESPADETLVFGLDGSSYEIDLSSANAARLRDALAPFVAAGRRSGARPRVAAGRRRASSGGSNPAEIRAWAQSQGMTVSSRGRVPAEIRAAYESAH